MNWDLTFAPFNEFFTVGLAIGMGQVGWSEFGSPKHSPIIAKPNKADLYVPRLING